MLCYFGQNVVCSTKYHRVKTIVTSDQKQLSELAVVRFSGYLANKGEYAHIAGCADKPVHHMGKIANIVLGQDPQPPRSH